MSDREPSTEVSPSRHRRLFVALAVTLGLAVPGAVMASDRHQDMPDDQPYHDDAARMADAGITVGCSADPPRYCPGEPLTRGQMAAFLNRGLSRTGFHTSVASLSAANGFRGVPATVTIETGGEPGATGYVVLQGSVTVYAGGDTTTCPCEVEAFIYREGDEEAGPSSWTQLPRDKATTGTASTSAPVTWAVPVATGTSTTFHLAVFVNGSTPGDASAEGALSAVYVPFGS